MLAILISASLSLPTTEYHLCPYIEKCGLAQNYLCDDFCDTPACNYGEMIRVFNAKCTYAGCRESFDWEKANMNIDVAVKSFDNCIRRAERAMEYNNGPVEEHPLAHQEKDHPEEEEDIQDNGDDDHEHEDEDDNQDDYEDDDDGDDDNDDEEEEDDN